MADFHNLKFDDILCDVEFGGMSDCKEILRLHVLPWPERGEVDEKL